MYNAVVGKIERYLAESRRSKNKEGKDPFIDELVKKQLFWLYMDEMYQLKWVTDAYILHIIVIPT